MAAPSLHGLFRRRPLLLQLSMAKWQLAPSSRPSPATGAAAATLRGFAARRAVARGLTPRASGLKISSDPPHPLVKKAKDSAAVIEQLRQLSASGDLSAGSLAFAAKRCGRRAAASAEHLQQLHEVALQSGVKLTAVYFSALLRAHTNLGLYSEARQVWSEMRRLDVEPDEPAFTAALHLCGKTADRTWAEQLWAELSSQSLPSSTIDAATALQRRRALLASYLFVHAVSANWDEVDNLLAQMKSEGLPYDPPLLGSLLHASARLGDGERAQQYWNRLVAEGVTPDEMSHRQLKTARESQVSQVVD
eukprot:TRINITY_DN13671_c0_g2_i1.p1 TRINITY_DN13671_c0_g2~~TRINITY_DN13671_c0_g2_i1.p1  ORF type:complete len:306 (-),score=58.70 TRINITY_DN13671_c0_g2_i1:30-947(-)